MPQGGDVLGEFDTPSDFHVTPAEAAQHPSPSATLREEHWDANACSFEKELVVTNPSLRGACSGISELHMCQLAHAQLLW